MTTQHPVHETRRFAGRRRRAVLAAAATAALTCLFSRSVIEAGDERAPLSKDAASKLFFDDVKPLLQKRCFGCHGAGDEIEAGLDLRTRSLMLKGGDTGPALVPGQPEKSPLYTAVLRTGDLVMPPKKRNRLTDQETAALKNWIAAGAPWPKARPVPNAVNSPAAGWNGSDGVRVATSGGLSEDWTNRRYKPDDVWAYQPVRRHAVPWEALPTGVGRHPIDAFLARALENKNLEPAPSADRWTFIRRVTFDLTGLPPAPADVDAFVNDESSDAFETLVDRLLKSPRYGEQAARHWLDVVRYADTAGFSNDFERPNAWRYRDYVVRSFNSDKPFDRFIVEQIAGDELDADDPENLVAVGYLRMGPWEHTGMSVAAVTRQLFLDDVTNSVGVTFLGQGLRCASCHDHKFDPVPTRDYYRIQAAFAPVQFADRSVDYRRKENVASFKRTRPRIERLLKDANDELAALRRLNQERVAAYLKKRGVKSFNDLPQKERSSKNYFGLTPEEKSRQKIFSKRKSYFERELKRYEPYAFSLYSGPDRPFKSNNPVHKIPGPKQRRGGVDPTRILTGGAVDAAGETVTPGVLSAVAGSNDRVTATAWNTVPESTEGRRLALARWIASPSNTLTARVFVNRVWQQHFGTGLVDTPNNFGKMGGRPSHPELLDWLATWFVEHDWSVKELHRLIATSAAYQRSGGHPDFDRVHKVDPINRLLAYFPPRRLAAEEIRDAMLAITGELNSEMGGPGAYPEINWEVAMQPRHIMGSVAPAYQPSPTPAERNRRSIYCFRIRTLKDPMMEVFNRPSSDVSCPVRDETTVTPQVFAQFNGANTHNRALALADVLMKSAEDAPGRIEAGFASVYGRRPTPKELQASLAHVRKMTAHHRNRPPVTTTPPTSVVREMVEELTGESFEWTDVLDLMDNYQSDLKPSQVDTETRALAELCLVLFNSNEFLYVR